MSQSNILDKPVPDIGVSVLKPTPYKQIIPTLKSIALTAGVKAKKRITEFADWLMAYIPAARSKASDSIQKVMNLFPKKQPNVLDSPVPDIGVPVLKPTPYKQKIPN